MAFRALVAKQFADLLAVLSHPARFRVVEELGASEKDVNALAEVLAMSPSGMSQHLALLRARHVVSERREGRHVYYRLSRPELATWLVEGLRFIEPEADAEVLRSAVAEARSTWGRKSKSNGRSRASVRG